MVYLQLHVHPVIANTEQTFFSPNNSLNVNNIIFEPLTKIGENIWDVTFTPITALGNSSKCDIIQQNKKLWPYSTELVCI